MLKLMLSAFAGALLLSGFASASEAPVIAQGKKILVVYYSKTGNTGRVANDVAAALGADCERIIDKKNRNGFFAFFGAGGDAMHKKTTAIEPPQKDPATYDLVVVGTPIWAGNITPAIRTWLTMNKDKCRAIACIVTAGGMKAEKVVPSFTEITGKQPVAVLGYVKKELKDEKIYREKLRAFIEELKR
jgi:menaquinone-dependent protoporphyrinogen IX oxidase